MAMFILITIHFRVVLEEFADPVVFADPSDISSYLNIIKIGRAHV